jgi:hypothetical protein
MRHTTLLVLDTFIIGNNKFITAKLEAEGEQVLPNDVLICAIDDPMDLPFELFVDQRELMAELAHNSINRLAIYNRMLALEVRRRDLLAGAIIPQHNRDDEADLIKDLLRNKRSRS